MKHLAIILALSTFLFAPSAARAETITIVGDSWCPYNCDPASDHPGYMIELAQKAFSKYGIEVNYISVPWSRAIEDTRQSKYNATVGGFRSDTPDFIFPAVPQGRSNTLFFVKKDDAWRYTGIESLPEASIGLIAGYSYGDEVDAYIEKNKDDSKLIQTVSGDNALEVNLRKLMGGRIRTLMEDSYVMGHFLSQHPDLQGQVAPAGDRSVIVDDNFIAFSPANPHSERYANILAKETEALRASGELQKILDRYGVSDFAVLTAEGPASPAAQ